MTDRTKQCQHQYLLNLLLRITGDILIEFVSCSRDLYNLMNSGMISDWKSTFSQNALSSMYLNQRDIIKRYDNYSIALLGNNINIKDQFTIWRIEITDTDDNHNHDNNHNEDITNCILFLFSYLTLCNYYDIKYDISEIMQSIRIDKIHSSSTICHIEINLRYLKNFVGRMNNRNSDNNSYLYHHGQNNGAKQEFDCTLKSCDSFDELINESNGINDKVIKLLENELFLPDLIQFKQCHLITIYIKLFETIGFGHLLPRKSQYTACCVKVQETNNNMHSFVVWNSILNDDI